ncbi:tRNA (guanosine(37)-N1)-methyltransferase TrmD [Parafrankia soli]|uniref:tRNA (guanine-N(1)-)-methyltransferase n=1 Tax=Parafrankia soli TaxID=2599596 RepID=A0A1S1R578_9ACTN|nr:tRNA (guanosine(37)-N1)-methyltransferase TrmD [Parafrankia soli]OHV40452.1 tRNA (guanosine(37)-N1)-methyltransferase TrmD [Parafrankia soli]
MRIDVVTIFPDYLRPLELALVGRAASRDLVDIQTHDLRAWTHDVHRTVDDSPYGGGPGMVMRPEPWDAALRDIVARDPSRRPRVVVPTPAGVPFTQSYAAELAEQDWLIFCCGRYEGIDGRVVDAWADDEISIGDYVLAGGEVATLVMVEAVTRLLPGVVGNAESIIDDSFAHGLLEGPVYTRPPVWEGRAVPEILRSGDHAAIARWRREEALRRTRRRRPELLDRIELSDADRAVVASTIVAAHGGGDDPPVTGVEDAVTAAGAAGVVEDAVTVAERGTIGDGPAPSGCASSHCS